MKIYLFPGQGSQKAGMGKDLFNLYPDLTELADSVLGYSVRELCIGDDGRLNLTEYTQPALFTVSALDYLHYKELNGEPDFAAGHSLGEYAALFASGAISFEQGVALTKERGKLMGKATGGAMAAITGLNKDKVLELLTANKEFCNLHAANYNTPEQTVIAGPRELIEKAEAKFIGAGAQQYIILRTSGAFHTNAMQLPSAQFGYFASGFTFKDMAFPVVSNVTARPYPKQDPVKLLIRQMYSPVKWYESLQWLLGREKEESEFKILGPGSSLAGMLRKVKRLCKPIYD